MFKACSGHGVGFEIKRQGCKKRASRDGVQEHSGIERCKVLKHQLSALQHEPLISAGTS